MSEWVGCCLCKVCLYVIDFTITDANSYDELKLSIGYYIFVTIFHIAVNT